MIPTWYRESSLIVASLAVIAMFTMPVAGDEPKKSLTAREILDRVAKTYSECETYRDTGEVSITFIQETGDRLDIRPFKTAFVRPDRFRYQYLATNPANITTRYLIWRKGDDIKTWWDITPGVQKPESLSLALAAATGVSGGSAHTMPTLLMSKEIGGFKLTDLPEIRRLDDAKIDEVDCYRVEVLYGKAPKTFWIEKKTSLILKIIEHHDFVNFKTDQVTTYKPVVGEKISDESLVFDPPKPKDD